MLTASAVVITPFLLEAAAPASKDWQQLSDISQAYGALSVLFSAAALVGVIASIAQQSRQTAVAIEQALRASHQHLIEMALNSPELLAGGEPFSSALTPQLAKQVMFSNLLVSNWLAEYRLQRMTDDELRVQLHRHFRGEVPRKFWEGASRAWQQSATASKDRKKIRFVAIVDEAYSQAVAEGPAIPTSAYFSSNV
ncbi:DUF6082 family protein [Streptomyces sp. NPDC059169]|uniref:DUF6082 family protein n=1 Tax=unclassified Streptomyces TaxID=2593676 RepID=UPI0036AA1E64